MIQATRQSTKSCRIQLIKNIIKTSKASYYSHVCSQSKGNSRKTGQTINVLTSRGTNNTTAKELKLNGSIISNFSEFSTIGPRLANEIPPNDNNNDLSYINIINVNNNKFSFSSTSSIIVFSKTLIRSKATGLDNITAKIIRECDDLISVSLYKCDLFNKSLLFGIFPDDCKSARVTPLFKQGEASDLSNSYLSHFFFFNFYCFYKHNADLLT